MAAKKAHNWNNKALDNGMAFGFLNSVFNPLLYSAGQDCKLIFLNCFLQLCQMLTLDPDKRIAVAEALNHPYLDEGRLRYHSCMCACCHTSASGMRQYSREFEPSAERPFDDEWERELTCVSKVKDKMHRFILDQINSNRVPLCINPSSAAYKSFASSTVAHPSELPPSPHHWE